MRKMASHNVVWKRLPSHCKAVIAFCLTDGSSIHVYSARGSGLSFIVKTIHISCKSDTYLGLDHEYGGIIVYARNGETDWFSANGTHCKSGYGA